MAWDLETIKNCVTETESKRRSLFDQMTRYEQAWKLQFWSAEERRLADVENRKLYTSPAPRNLASLAVSLLCGRTKVRCPSFEATDESIKNADLRAEFLEILIEKQAHIAEMALLDALAWFAVVRGRVALQLVWVQDVYEKKLAYSGQPPILYRVLDPMGVGVARDSLGVRWAYHKYTETVASVKSRYPKAFEGVLERQPPDADKEVTVTDFWYDDKGVIYNAVLIDDEFVKKPKKTRYPIIPIFERNSDPTPAREERWRSAAIFEGMLETWGEMNYLHSMHLTSIGRYFWPSLYYTNPEQEEVPPLDTGMGAINELPRGVEFTSPPNNNPDVALASSALEMLNKYQQDATFPDVLMGDPGQLKAAYGIAMMASSAVRRIKAAKEQIQTLLSQANCLALWCVKSYAPGGVTLYGYDETTSEVRSASLTSDQVGDRFDNVVDINTNVPSAQLQEMVMGMQLVVNRIISRDTYRRQWLPVGKEPPRDEEVRLLIERIEDDPDLLSARIRQAYDLYYGTPLPPGEPDFEKTPPAGMNGGGPVPMSGQGAMPPGQPMQGPPPGMPPPGPPPMQGPPPGMPPGMPPELLQQAQMIAQQAGVPVEAVLQQMMQQMQGGAMPQPGMGQPALEMPFDPSMGAGGYEFQGGISPDMLGFDPSDPQTQMLMQMIMQGNTPGPQAQSQMLQDQYRRR